MRPSIVYLVGHQEVGTAQVGSIVPQYHNTGLTSLKFSWPSPHGDKVTAIAPDITSSHNDIQRQEGKWAEGNKSLFLYLSHFIVRPLLPRSHQQTSPYVSQATNGSQPLPWAPLKPRGAEFSSCYMVDWMTWIKNSSLKDKI